MGYCGETVYPARQPLCWTLTIYEGELRATLNFFVLDPILLYQAVDLPSVDSQGAGGACFVAFLAAEDIDDLSPFDRGQIVQVNMALVLSIR